jgi:ethanolamine kinase
MRPYAKSKFLNREGETRSHTLLAQYGLAPPLLARFQNGLLYRFIRGQPTKPADLVEPAIWKAVARRLGQWHATLPVVSHTSSQTANSSDGQGAVFRPEKTIPVQKGDDITPIRPRQAGPNTWTVLQKWILALPAGTEDQRLRRQGLQKELERIVAELDDGNGIGEDGVRFNFFLQTFLIPVC